MIYKFVKHEVPELETLKGSTYYNLYEKVNQKEKLTRAEKDYLFKQLFANAYSRKGIPRHGWMFDFSTILKKYWVKFKHGYIAEYYAPDRTSIRSEFKDVCKVMEVI